MATTRIIEIDKSLLDMGIYTLKEVGKEGGESSYLFIVNFFVDGFEQQAKSHFLVEPVITISLIQEVILKELQKETDANLIINVI